MRKEVRILRDLEKIESELNSNFVGVVALSAEEEKVLQIATNYVYLDKNIYFFLKKDEDFFENIGFDTNGSFVLLNQSKAKKSSKYDFVPVYHFISVNVSGTIRIVEEKKVIDDVRKAYLSKFSKRSTGEKVNFNALGKLLMIDTEEIYAYEEAGE
jgi:nitroimidazol reductase NimA-like FMN-containing flavoprotein (pyridoxamine 5'-phosphate oxidase superfamily)